MKRALCFAYTVGGGIYINMTNACTNNCSFCIRNNGDGAYGSDSLWLEREPSVDEVIAAVAGLMNEKCTELVFCGYGEPTVRLDDVLLVLASFKETYPDLPVRINTNGQADLIHSRDTAECFGGFDAVSVSLNAPSAERYNEICRSKYKEQALPAILKFAEKVNNSFENVQFSVVREMISEDELRECYRISESLSIPLRVRDYISE